jgi:hypothetical protein
VESAQDIERGGPAVRGHPRPGPQAIRRGTRPRAERPPAGRVLRGDVLRRATPRGSRQPPPR